MKMQLVLGYKDLFGEPRPDISELLKNVPSSGVIGFFSAINNALNLKGDSVETQLMIFRAFGRSFPREAREKLISQLALIRTTKGPFTVFGVRYVIAFIYRELANYRDFEQTEVAETEELDVLKAYLAFVDEVHESETKDIEDIITTSQTARDNQLQRMVWPYFIRQFEFAYELDVLFELTKGVAFLTFLQNHGQYSDDLNAFLATIGCKEPLEYIGGLMQLIKSNYNLVDGKELMNFSLRLTMQPTDPVVRELIFDFAGQKGKAISGDDFLQLKSKPIVRFYRDEYFIPHWNYIYLAMFQGLVFAFYRQSGIAKRIKDFDAYKSQIGTEFTEKAFFRKIMKCCFQRKHSQAFFPTSSDGINPDFYYREGNVVYLFEFKDALLARTVIQSNSFDEIKSKIDEKLAQRGGVNGKQSKGVYQLARLIKDILQDGTAFFQLDTAAQRGKIKQRNLTVYPIIVHGNIYFDMPGVNDYLQNCLKDELSNDAFKKVKPITVINLQYFFQRLQMFRDGKLRLKDELDSYQSELHRRAMRAARSGNPDDKLNSLPSFHEYHLGQPETYKDYKREYYFDAVFECLGIPISQGPLSVGSAYVAASPQA